jgi:uncharacterized membrane protein YoaK (UPF0700 family)
MRIRPGREAPLLLSLALAAGSVDALTYLGLGRVFTANMTGNTVLLGVAVAQGSSSDALRALVALGGFCLGGALGMALIGTRRGPWPRLTWAVFALETVGLAALLAAWQAAGAGSLRALLVVLSGVAMGAQSAAVRISEAGINTTYMTSTLLNALARVVPGARRSGAGAGLSAAAVAVYALGALAGAEAEDGWGAPAVAVPLVIVAAVSTTTFLWRRREGPADDEGAQQSRA